MSTEVQPKFQIDSEIRRLFINGQVVPLSIGEFKFAEALVRHPGVTIPYSKLKHEVWGREYVQMTAITGTAKRLRTKIRQFFPDCEPIKTYHGVGYAWALGAPERLNLLNIQPSSCPNCGYVHAA